MLRAPCFIAFAIIITISQVFQIALIPYLFNTFGNKIQNLNVKDGTNSLFNFENWENIKETDKNKNGIERKDKNLPKKCYKGGTRKSFVYYPNMFDEDQNFLEAESAIQKILTSSITKTISKPAFSQNPTFSTTISNI